MLPKEINPPALVDPELSEVTRNIFVANFLEQAVNVFAFDANHGLVDALAPRMIFVPTAGETDTGSSDTLVENRFEPVFVVGDGRLFGRRGTDFRGVNGFRHSWHLQVMRSMCPSRKRRLSWRGGHVEDPGQPDGPAGGKGGLR